MAINPRPRTVLIHALRAEVTRGLCIYCERQLTGRQKFKCTDEECLRAYNADYDAQRRKLAKEARLSQDVDTEEGK